MKKKKLGCMTLSNITGGYYDAYPVKTTFTSGAQSRVVRGYLYKFDRLTDPEKEQILKYKNARLVITQCQYAPEIKRAAVILYERCIDNLF